MKMSRCRRRNNGRTLERSHGSTTFGISDARHGLNLKRAGLPFDVRHMPSVPATAHSRSPLSESRTHNYAYEVICLALQTIKHEL